MSLPADGGPARSEPDLGGLPAVVTGSSRGSVAAPEFCERLVQACTDAYGGIGLLDAGRHLRGQVLSFDGTQLSVWSHPEATSTWTQPDGWTPGTVGDALTADVMQYPHSDRWGAGIRG